IKTILEEEGYTTSTAEDGHSALAQIEQSPPHLVLLDVMMPGMNGIQVVRRIQQNRHLSSMSIIMLTGRSLSSEDNEFDNLETDGFICKPVEFEILLSRVRAILATKDRTTKANKYQRLASR
ncbi:MAG TPA: hybrid sensor histidine kinase/response regulator, partial [Cyanobacteria bacterium UBA11049]|nr:hybrid sensor histidine kinase/response regulator [Cyanobacteria bacterium UBA11049]